MPYFSYVNIESELRDPKSDIDDKNKKLLNQRFQFDRKLNIDKRSDFLEQQKDKKFKEKEKTNNYIMDYYQVKMINNEEKLEYRDVKDLIIRDNNTTEKNNMRDIVNKTTLIDSMNQISDEKILKLRKFKNFL